MDSKEFRKAFDDSVIRAGRLLTSALVVLVLITVVVEFELYDRQQRIAMLEIRAQEEQLKLINVTRLYRRDLPEITLTTLTNRDVIFQKVNQAIEATNLSGLSQILNEIEADKDSATNSTNLHEFNRILRVVKRLQIEMGTYTADKQRITAALRELKETAASEKGKTNQSIPTPFGTFNIHPRLGLLLVSFANTAAYLMFASMKLRVRRALLRLTDNGAQVHVGNLDLPYWLYPLDGAVRRAVHGARNHWLPVVGSIALQVVWLLLGVVLVLECRRWNLQQSIWYGSMPPVNAILWVGLIAHSIMACHGLLGDALANSTRSFGSRLEKWKPKWDRRSFITATVGGILILSGWGWIRFRRRFFRGLAIRSPDLVVNAKSGVIHHHRICAGHLPKGSNVARLNEMASQVALHRSKSAAIYEALAILADDREAAELLESAIRASPLSIHLHDRLIRIYGRLRRYSEIFKVLESGLRQAESLAQQPQLSQGRKAAADRMVVAFEARIQYANHRRERALANRGDQGPNP